MERTGELRIEPYSPKWFELRQGCFTASELYKLMSSPREKSRDISVTAETYILEKVHEKLTGKTKMGVNNFATEWGIENEPLAKKWYARLTGNSLADPYLLIHDTIEGYSCTPDSLVNSEGLAEYKCPANGANHLKHCFITTDEYFKKEHPDYYWQCMSQMHISGKSWCDFVSFDPRINSDLGMFIYRLHANDEAFKLIEVKVKRCREIFNDYFNLFASGPETGTKKFSTIKE